MPVTVEINGLLIIRDSYTFLVVKTSLFLVQGSQEMVWVK